MTASINIAEINVSYKPTKPAGPRIDSSSTVHEYLRMLYSEESVALQETIHHSVSE